MYFSNIVANARSSNSSLYPNAISHLCYACVQTFFGLYASANANLARLTQSNLVAKHSVVFLGGALVLVALVTAKLWKKEREIQNRETALGMAQKQLRTDQEALRRGQEASGNREKLLTDGKVAVARDQGALEANKRKLVHDQELLEEHKAKMVVQEATFIREREAWIAYEMELRRELEEKAVRISAQCADYARACELKLELTLAQRSGPDLLSRSISPMETALALELKSILLPYKGPNPLGSSNTEPPRLVPSTSPIDFRGPRPPVGTSLFNSDTTSTGSATGSAADLYPDI